jgi:hypothetical protein
MQRRVMRPGVTPGFPAARMFRVPGGVVPMRSGLGGGSHRSPAFPLPDGGIAPDVWPYDERNPWWNVGPGGVPSLPPMVGSPPPGLAPGAGAGGYAPTPAPYAPADPNSPLKWSNPNTVSIVPILASTPANQPVLSLNYQRTLLVIQNNSTANSPDTTPIFYVNFNAQVSSAGLGLALAAGIGIVFDIICPRDSVYVLQVGGGGASLVVAGVVAQGTYAPASQPIQQ